MYMSAPASARTTSPPPSVNTTACMSSPRISWVIKSCLRVGAESAEGARCFWLFRPQRPQRLPAQYVVARGHADDADECGRDERAERGEARRGPPRNVEHVARHTPGQHDRPGGSDEAGQQPEPAVFEGEHRAEHARARAERAED